MLVLIAVTPALSLPQATRPKPTGAQQIGTASYTHTDASRIETLVARMYPEITHPDVVNAARSSVQAMLTFLGSEATSPESRAQERLR